MASSRWVEALLPVSECISPKLPESSADALQGFDREGFAIGGALCFRRVGTAWERIGLARPIRAPEISMHGLAVATGRIEAAMDVLLSRTYRTEANRRLAKQLRHEQP